MRGKLLLFMFVVVTAGASEIKAQSLVIKTIDGTENVQKLSSLQNFTFFNNSLLLKYVGGSSESYSVSTIRKIYFKTASTGIENVKGGTGKMFIYPNPAGNEINIQNLPEETSDVSIYRMDGVMVLQTRVTSDNKAVNISNLAKGLYLLKIKNQVIKFIKL